jgi:hypothetical protein
MYNHVNSGSGNEGVGVPQHMRAKLSVGLIVGEMRQRAEQSVAHLLAQDAVEELELLVVDVGQESGGLIGADHPRVRYTHRPDLTYYCDAQIELVREASAPFLAFIEDHSFAAPGWARALLAAFEDPRVAAVNYMFTNAEDARYLSRSVLMAEYGYWMTPHPGGPLDFSSSTNIAYRLACLRPLLQGHESAFEAEFLIHRALLEQGRLIWLAPDAVVAHESWRSLADACAANGSNKRVLGARRASDGRWGYAFRLAWAGGMVFAPALFLARLAWALRHRPSLWGRYLTGFPVCVSIYSYSAWCEALGYLFGAGSSRHEFRARELSMRRDGLH